MTLAETYALSCGVQIDKPFIDCEFYPLWFSKYIVVHNSTGMPSKTYDFYQDVIDEIKPILDEQGVTIIQIGLSDDTLLHGCEDFRGKTSLRQTAYLIKNSMLLLSGDTFSAHMAGAMDIPLVALYGITRIENCRPYWGNPKKQILLSADYSVRKPTYSPQETPKRINEIKIENVIDSVLKLLKLPRLKLKTYHVGKNYPESIVEIILNEPPVEVKNSSLNIRLDKNNDNFNPQFLFKLLIDNHCNMIIDRPFDFKPYMQLKDKIIGVSYDVSNGCDFEHVEELKSMGLKVLLETNKEEELNDLRFRFLDLTVDLIPKVEKIDLPKDCLVKTRKTILCGMRRFISIAHYEKNLDMTENSSILDEDNFWKDKDYYYFYGKPNRRNKRKR